MPLARWRDAIARHPELTLADRVVGITLSTVMTTAGTATIGMDWLAKHAQLSERAVRRARTKLKRLELLRWKSGNGRGKVTEYIACVGGVALAVLPEALPGFEFPNPGNGDAQTPAPLPGEPGWNREPSQTPAEKPADPEHVRDILTELRGVVTKHPAGNGRAS